MLDATVAFARRQCNDDDVRLIATISAENQIASTKASRDDSVQPYFELSRRGDGTLFHLADTAVKTD